MAGSAALNVSRFNSWQVWSTNPANDIRGNLPYDFKQYNASYVAPVLGQGNWFFYTLAPIITPVLSPVTKTYDGLTAVALGAANFTATGTIDGDSVTLGATTAAYDNKNAGSGKTVSASGISLVSAANGTATVYGYQLASTTATGAVGTITPKEITLTGASAAGKVYDGSTAAQVSGSLDGKIAGDDTSLPMPLSRRTSPRRP